ncbi:MAG TPA: hypothetical protein VJT50_10350 [Pyrinomonadaceae bacterium]|nr:hypothetical protein [Pyrinomonadaceae bacterium]
MSAPEVDPVERTLTAACKIYYDVYPADRANAPLLIALHGYGANKKQMGREATQMAPVGFSIVALQGFHQHLKEPKQPGGPLRYGFGWLSNFHPEDSVQLHHQALLDVIDTQTREQVIDPTRVYLLGFSQSCALNYRFAFTYPDVMRGVAGICGGLPGDWETSDGYKPTKAGVFHLAGRRDEFYPPERVADYEERLKLRARNVTFKSYDAAHEIVPAMRDDIRAWLQKG